MGTNRANPAAMILSATMMLRHLGSVLPQSNVLHRLIYFFTRLDSIANSIASATFDVINGGKVRTADMGGQYLFIYLIKLEAELQSRQALPQPPSSPQLSSRTFKLLSPSFFFPYRVMGWTIDCIIACGSNEIACKLCYT